MSFYVGTCPHCSTKQIALRVVAAEAFGSHAGNIHFECPHCNKPSCGQIQSNTGGANFTNAVGSKDSLNSFGFTLVEIWPEPPKAQIPDHIPDNVGRSLAQAEANFQLDEHDEAAGVMYRKALDLGLKAIDPSLKGMLATRIEQLGKAGKLTDELVAWAKEIKNLGNDGAHEEEAIERKELEALRGLTDMVLRYLFTLPKIVRQRKEGLK